MNILNVEFKSFVDGDLGVRLVPDISIQSVSINTKDSNGKIVPLKNIDTETTELIIYIDAKNIPENLDVVLNIHNETADKKVACTSKIVKENGKLAIKSGTSFPVLHSSELHLIGNGKLSFFIQLQEPFGNVFPIPVDITFDNPLTFQVNCRLKDGTFKKLGEIDCSKPADKPLKGLKIGSILQIKPDKTGKCFENSTIRLSLFEYEEASSGEGQGSEGPQEYIQTSEPAVLEWKSGCREPQLWYVGSSCYAVNQSDSESVLKHDTPHFNYEAVDEDDNLFEFARSVTINGTDDTHYTQVCNDTQFCIEVPLPEITSFIVKHERAQNGRIAVTASGKINNIDPDFNLPLILELYRKNGAEVSKCSSTDQTVVLGGTFNCNFTIDETSDSLFGVVYLPECINPGKKPFCHLINFDENTFAGFLNSKIIDAKNLAPAICSEEVMGGILKIHTIKDLFDDVRVKKVIYAKSGAVPTKTRIRLLTFFDEPGGWKVSGKNLSSPWYIDRFQRGLVFLNYLTAESGQKIIDHTFGAGTNSGWGKFIHEKNPSLLLDEKGQKVANPSENEFKSKWFLIYKEVFELFISEIYKKAWQMTETDFEKQLSMLDSVTKS